MLKVVFFGTPTFAAKTLEFLLQNNINVVAVVTRPDRPQGRSRSLTPSPVKLVSQKRNLPLYQPEKASAPDFAPILEQYQADLFVVVAYGEIVKQNLLDMPRLACINVHASLLPKYRGAAPIQQAVINGETMSGITIMHMVKKLDAGDIIKSASVSIDPNMTAGELEEELLIAGENSLLEVIHDFEKEVPPRTPQNPDLVTYAAKVEPCDGELYWTESAKNLHNRARGVTPKPGAWCWVEINGVKKRLKIKKTKYVDKFSGQPGEILEYEGKTICIACGEGTLQILELQLEGKKPMDSASFLRGLPQNQITFIQS